MGSSESKPEVTPTAAEAERAQEAQESIQARLQRQQQEELERERLEWNRQQMLEQHWREQKLREEQLRKEAQKKWEEEQEIKQKQEIKRQQEILRQQEITRQQEILRQQAFERQQEIARREEFERQQEIQARQVTLRRQEFQRQQEILRQQAILGQQGLLRQEQILWQQRNQQQHCQVQHQQLQTRPSPVPQSNSGHQSPVSQSSRPRQPSANTSETPSTRRNANTSEMSIKKIANTPKSSSTKKNASNDPGQLSKGWSNFDYIVEKNHIKQGVASKIKKLLKDGNTVPFIARYRKAITQGMNIEKVRKIKDSYDYAKLVKEQAVNLKEIIEKQGNWTNELHNLVYDSKSLPELDYIQSVYENGKFIQTIKIANPHLGSKADSIVKGDLVEPLSCDVIAHVEGLKTTAQVKDRIVSVIADTISKNKRVYDLIKKLRSKYDLQIKTNIKGDQLNDENMEKYDSYRNFSSSVKDLAYDEYWTITKGDFDNVLNIQIIIPDQLDKAFKDECLKLYKEASNVSWQHKEFINDAIDRMYNRSIKPFIKKRTREEINEKAEIEATKMTVEAIKLVWSDDDRHPGLLGAGPSENLINNMTKDHLNMFRKPNSATKFREAIMDAISYMGVDLNETTETHLKWIPGLDDEKAKNIIHWRASFGAFTVRTDLKKVQGIDEKTFQQCAGFVRIMPKTAVRNDGQRVPLSSLNYLDQTVIHPENYPIAEAFLKEAKCNPNTLGTKAFKFAVKLYAAHGAVNLAKKLRTSKEVMEIIIKGLTMEEEPTASGEDNTAEPERQRCFNDLTIGTVLTGVVTNVTHHGAFVDVGIERDGLIIQRYMGGMTVSIGDRVETEVNSIEKDRRRFGLTLIKRL